MDRKLRYVAEIAGVILVGAVAVFCCLKLFGHGLISSIGSVWVANVLMLLAIYGSLRSRAQGWEHLGLKPNIVEPNRWEGLYFFRFRFLLSQRWLSLSVQF